MSNVVPIKIKQEQVRKELESNIECRQDELAMDMSDIFIDIVNARNELDHDDSNDETMEVHYTLQHMIEEFLKLIPLDKAEKLNVFFHKEHEDVKKLVSDYKKGAK